MKNKEVLVLVAVLATLLLACNFGGGRQPDAGGGEHAAGQPHGEPENELVFANKLFSKQAGDCSDEEADCMDIVMNELQASGGKPGVADRINARLGELARETLAGFVENPDVSATLESLADGVLSDYERYVQENPNDGFNRWFVEGEAMELVRQAGWVCIQWGTSSYTGGAHPNSYTNLLNFDLGNGKFMLLTDFVADTTVLKKEAEAKLREVYDIAPDAALSESGFFVDELPMPANYTRNGRGMVLFYNPYEIGPYAMGPVEILVDEARLEGSLK